MSGEARSAEMILLAYRRAVYAYRWTVQVRPFDPPWGAAAIAFARRATADILIHAPGANVDLWIEAQFETWRPGTPGPFLAAISGAGAVNRLDRCLSRRRLSPRAGFPSEASWRIFPGHFARGVASDLIALRVRGGAESAIAARYAREIRPETIAACWPGALAGAAEAGWIDRAEAEAAARLLAGDPILLGACAEAALVTAPATVPRIPIDAHLATLRIVLEKLSRIAA